MLYIFALLFIFLDQITKYFAKQNLIDSPVKIFNWFKLEYVENRGAAFGILAGKQTLFILITVFVLMLLGFYIYKHYQFMPKLEIWASIFLISGALGNLIDRILNGYVIDFISVRIFNIYDFPVFNFADIYVTFSVIIYLIAVFIHEKN